MIDYYEGESEGQGDLSSVPTESTTPVPSETPLSSDAPVTTQEVELSQKYYDKMDKIELSGYILIGVLCLILGALLVKGMVSKL